MRYNSQAKTIMKQNPTTSRTFIDATALFAFVDSSNQKHQQIEDSINLVQSLQSGVTCDYFLRELSNRARKTKLEYKVNQLIWSIRNGSRFDVIKVLPEDEELAWGLFSNTFIAGIEFSHCLLVVLSIKYRIENLILANEAFEIYLPILLRKISNYQS